MTLNDFYCKLRINVSLCMMVILCRLLLLEGKQSCLKLMQCLLISDPSIPLESILGDTSDHAHEGQGVLCQRSDITGAAYTRCT